MDKRTWQDIVVGTVVSHAGLLRTHGSVLRPEVHAVTAGKRMGCIQLRRVFRRDDVRSVIARMAEFPNAASADEVVVTWETQDIAATCGLPARHEGAGLNVLWATPTERILYSHTYREQEVGVTPTGRKRVEPYWTSSGTILPTTDLEPVIGSLLDFCFQPLATQGDDVFEQRVARLRDEGYFIFPPI